MPGLPGGFGDSLSKLESLPEGTELEIVAIEGPNKTDKNGYESYTVEVADGTRYFTLATGVRRKLQQVQEAVANGTYKFGPDDPITCKTTRYESKYGKECVGLG